MTKQRTAREKKKKKSLLDELVVNEISRRGTEIEMKLKEIHSIVNKLDSFASKANN